MGHIYAYICPLGGARHEQLAALVLSYIQLETGREVWAVGAVLSGFETRCNMPMQTAPASTYGLTPLARRTSECSGRPGALAERPGQTPSRGESVASSGTRLASGQAKAAGPRDPLERGIR